MPRAAAKKKKTKRPPEIQLDFAAIMEEILGVGAGEFFKMFGGGLYGEIKEPVKVSPIPPEMFKKMLFLCHPDKHGNHEHAIEVTRWLLEERKKSQH